MNNNFLESNYILQLKAGEEPAFAAIYEFYAAKVYRVAYKFLKDKTCSEEVVQETFIKLWLTKDQLDIHGNVWLYLFVITKRLSLNALRQRRISTSVAEYLVDQKDEFLCVTEEYINAHELELFTEKALKRLSKQQQQIYHLSRKEGLTHKEIAQQMHISPNTVKNHMVEALKSLKSYLKYADFIGILILLL